MTATNPTRPRIPTHLSRPSRRHYAQIVEDFSLQDDPAALATLRLALEAVDRADEARRELAKSGAYYINGRGEPRAHPAVAVERDSAIRAARLFRELALSDEYAEPRVPRPDGRSS